MSARDPRTDPRPGDVVRKGSVTREVLIFRERLPSPMVRFVCAFTSSRWSGGRLVQHPMRQKLWTRLAKWQDWCRCSEVVRVAQE